MKYYTICAVILSTLLLSGCDKKIEELTRNWCNDREGCHYIKQRQCICNGERIIH